MSFAVGAAREAETPEDEKSVLDEWIMAKAGDPMYRFGPVGQNFSPEIHSIDGQP